MSPMIKPSHRGLLHERLGIPEGKKISVATLMRAKGRDKARGDGAAVKQDVFALNFGGHNK
jgi:hypothetical protein